MASAARGREVTSGGMRSSASAMAALVLGGFCRGGAEAVFPTVGPEVFKAGQKLPLFVNELTSTRTQAPMDHYHVGYCKPQHLHENLENIGAYLEGEREKNSLYELQIGVEKTCSVLCAKKLERHERYMFGRIIADDYMAHMTVTGLPAAYEPEVGRSSASSAVLRGYPVGTVDSDGRTFLHNHLRITLAINPRDEGRTTFHIVGFLVEPFSVQHQYEGPWVEGAVISTCNQFGYSTSDPMRYLSTDYDGEALFTYDVMWDYTSMPWTQRWDIYGRRRGSPDNMIYWFIMINASVIVLFPTILVAMVMVIALRNDIQRYNAENMEEASEETGWKLVHGDVLRPPITMSMPFAVCVGTGVQLWSVCFLLLFFRMVRLVRPLKPGDMLTTFILIYVLTGGIAGYNAGKIHRRFRGTEWLKMTTFTAVAFPILSGSIFLFEAFQQWVLGSTEAVPPRILVLLVAMPLFVQMPLVFLGSFYGFKKEKPPQVVRTNQIPRMISQTPWYVDPKVTVPFAGVFPFGVVLKVLPFVMDIIWEQQPFFIFGFFMSVMFLVTFICAEMSIAMCYFQLRFEDYRWWWRSMLWSGSCAGWMFIYSIGYSFTALQTSGWMAASLFFGYNIVTAVSFFLLAGTVGYFSCQWFINAIYSSIKVN